MTALDCSVIKSLSTSIQMGWLISYNILTLCTVQIITHQITNLPRLSTPVADNQHISWCCIIAYISHGWCQTVVRCTQKRSFSLIQRRRRRYAAIIICFVIIIDTGIAASATIMLSFHTTAVSSNGTWLRFLSISSQWPIPSSARHTS